MLNWVIDSVLESETGEVIVVLGYNSKEIEREILVEEVEIVVNPDYERGMSTFLKEEAKEVNKKADAILFVLADQPLLEPKTINQIIGKYENSDYLIVAPFYNGRRGNAVLLDISLKEEIFSLEGDVGAGKILRDRMEEVGAVDVSSPSVGMDVDTEKDLEKVRKLLCD